MRIFVYYDLGSEEPIYVSDEFILESYFPLWKEKMLKVGKEALITEESCIEDFCIVNWAFEVKG